MSYKEHVAERRKLIEEVIKGTEKYTKVSISFDLHVTHQSALQTIFCTICCS